MNMGIDHTDKARFNALLDHVRAVVAGADMFDPRTRRKICTKADKLWTELRNARKRQILSELKGAAKVQA
jgi:hypothetical protein